MKETESKAVREDGRYLSCPFCDYSVKAQDAIDISQTRCKGTDDCGYECGHTLFENCSIDGVWYKPEWVPHVVEETAAKLAQAEAKLVQTEAERDDMLEVVARLAEILARITGEWTDKQIERMRSSDISPHPDYIEVARRLAGMPDDTTKGDGR